MTIEDNLRGFIKDLQKDNDNRSKKLNSGSLSERGHTAIVTEYNNTLCIIKGLIKIINR